MTKALLTVQDVKNFIYDAILERTKDGILNRKQMRAYFGISEFQLDKYLEMGLPWFGKVHRKHFKIHDVKQWFNSMDISFEENIG